MPAFTLYGAPGSTNTDRVRLTLAEGGFTDYELVNVNLSKGEQKTLIGLPPNEAVVSEALEAVEAFFDVAEGRLLQDNDYMAGNDFSLVDIFYVPLIQRLIVCGYGHIITNHKAVSGWWDRVVNRAAIQKILAVDKEAATAAGR
ncbi:hypothetical protein F66182_1077 [Fusarium sp. NRRL 66182]|nr:hypothetical protein F66182_1077 [Fusarium sp. NRRL 66182]